MNDDIERELMIKRIDDIIEDIRKTWADLNIYDVEQLKEAWNDPVCKEYVERVYNVDNNVDAIVSLLEGIKGYWNSYQYSEVVEGGLEDEQQGN